MNPDSPLLQEVVSISENRVELWARLITAVNAAAVAEVGVWKGDFAKQLLERCACIRRYWMIDPWANLPDWNKPFNVAQTAFDKIFAEALAKTDFAAERRIVLRGKTRDMADRIPAASLDFVYVDGDHTLRGITIDLINLLPRLREGGWLGGDDFTTDLWQHGPRFEPSLVCPFSVYFAEAMNLPFIALPYNQFLIHKCTNASFSFTDLTGRYGDLSLRALRATRGTAVLRRALKSVLRRLTGA